MQVCHPWHPCLSDQSNLLDNKYLSAQAALHRLAERQTDRFVLNMKMATKISVVHLSTRLKNLRADSVDANTARHVNRSTLHKTIECAVGGGGAGPARDWIAVRDTAGQRKGTVVIHIVDSLQYEVDLWKKLLMNTNHELFPGHFMYRPEMYVADSTHHRINSANFLIHRADTVDVFDIHLHITAGPANADDFVPTGEGIHCSSTNGTGSTYDDYLHHDILPPGF